jgi:hypothetical protein
VTLASAQPLLIGALLGTAVGVERALDARSPSSASSRLQRRALTGSAANHKIYAE